MAVFSLNVRKISRGAGSSAVRHAAYRAGERLHDRRAGRSHDYTSKRDVVYREIVAPKGAPDWARDRERLWNRVEETERRKDARLAQEVYVSIPREIRADRRADAIREFAQTVFVDKGMVADVAIHVTSGSDGVENPHGHITLTTRTLEADGFGGKRAEWAKRGFVWECREQWARHANRALARSGSLERIDSRSLRAQVLHAERIINEAIKVGDRVAAMRFAERAALLDRTPQPSLGRVSSHMERKGIRTERGDRLRQVNVRNSESLEARRKKWIQYVDQRLPEREGSRRRGSLLGALRRRFGPREEKVEPLPPPPIPPFDPERPNRESQERKPYQSAYERDPALREFLDNLGKPPPDPETDHMTPEERKRFIQDKLARIMKDPPYDRDPHDSTASASRQPGRTDEEERRKGREAGRTDGPERERD